MIGTTRVLIAAASDVERAGLEALVASRAELAVAGAVSDVASLAGEVERVEPDVALVAVEADEELDALVGLDAPPPIVVLAEDLDPASVAAALRAGARAVLPRRATGPEILAAVEAVAAGLLAL